MGKLVFSDIDGFLDQLGIHIDGLVEQLLSNPNDSESEIQLREISKAIERLESSGISIPTALLEEKSRLLNVVGSYRGYYEQAITIQSKLNALLIRLREVTAPQSRRNPDGNKKQETTPWRIVAKVVIETLRQEKRPMRRTEIWDEVYSQIKDRLLPGDFEPRKSDGRPFWKNTVSRVLYNLRKDNILKLSKQHGCNELEEVYYENQTPFD